MIDAAPKRRVLPPRYETIIFPTSGIPLKIGVYKINKINEKIQTDFGKRQWSVELK